MSCFCYCSVALPHGAMGWSAVCDCGISLSYSLAFFLTLGRLNYAFLQKGLSYKKLYLSNSESLHQGFSKGNSKFFYLSRDK